ncbi:MAG: bifunctional helix-turn-helix domain-containing protein/methylated-DNA--[protein]-cysteine S-methyltransferase [Pseudomonadota bacterium]
MYSVMSKRDNAGQSLDHRHLENCYAEERTAQVQMTEVGHKNSLADRSTTPVVRKPRASAAQNHFSLVASAITYLREHHLAQPSLAELAGTLEVSEAHLQKVFSAWAGVSPKRFLQVMNHRYARAALRRQRGVLDTSFDLGLSGPSRLHDLTVNCDAMTPGEIASKGLGLELFSGWATCPFGSMFVAWGERGICELHFYDGPTSSVERAFKDDWANASHTQDSEGAERWAARLFQRELQPGKLHLLLRGTNFQVKVWEALLRVPTGEIASYQDLAGRIQSPKASRAVGSALARNRIGYLIPCHRVIRESGGWGNYRWGLERKLAMHLWESPN